MDDILPGNRRYITAFQRSLQSVFHGNDSLSYLLQLSISKTTKEKTFCRVIFMNSNMTCKNARTSILRPELHVCSVLF